MFLFFLFPIGMGIVVSLYSEIRMVLKAAAVHVGWLLGTLVVPIGLALAIGLVFHKPHLSLMFEFLVYLVLCLLMPVGTLVFVMARWWAAKEHALAWFGGRALLFLAVVAASAAGAEIGGISMVAHADRRPREPRRTHALAARPPRVLPTETVSVGEQRIPSGSVGSTGQSAGQLIITSNVTGAPVTLDGVGIGVAPFTKDGVSPGHHVVACHLASFEPFTFELDLAPSDVVAVNVRLDPLGPARPGAFGYLTVDDPTPGREVRAFGDVIGRTPFVGVPVPAGLYDIEILGTDGVAVPQRVIVTTEQTLRVTASPQAPAGRRR